MSAPGRIRTVRGDIAPEALGYCQCHEHIFLQKGTPAELSPALCIDDLSLSEQELRSYLRRGGSAIVDAQPVGCGRDARALLYLSEQTNIHIVASTGFHRMAFYAPSHWLLQWDEARLADLFEREITEGMYAPCDDAPPEFKLPRCRAGQIKTALEPEGIAGQRRTLLSAAARAALSTNAPLMVHVERGSDPVALIDFWESFGVPPEKMIFCHMDRMIDSPETHVSVCRRGSYLEYDTIGRFKYHSDLQEAEQIERIVSAGYSDRLLLSLDTTRERLSSYGGGVGLCYLVETFLPFLKERGLSEESLRQMQQINPANVYALSRSRK